MAWVKLDDHFDEHDKVLAAGPDAMWVLLRGLAWCNRRETDGHIIPAALDRIGSDFGPQKRRKLVRRLVEVVLLHEPGHGCDRCPDPPDGWQVHDYGDYQPTRARKEAERAEARERMRRAREAKRQKRSSDVRTEQDANGKRTSVNPVPGPGVPDGTRQEEERATRHPTWTALASKCPAKQWGEVGTFGAKIRLLDTLTAVEDAGWPPDRAADALLAGDLSSARSVGAVLLSRAETLAATEPPPLVEVVDCRHCRGSGLWWSDDGKEAVQCMHPDEARTA